MKFDSELALLRHCRLVHETLDTNPQLPLFASPPAAAVPASPFRTPAVPTALAYTPAAAAARPAVFSPPLPVAASPAVSSSPAVVRTAAAAASPPEAASREASPLTETRIGRSESGGRRSGRRSAVSERFQLASKQPEGEKDLALSLKMRRIFLYSWRARRSFLCP